MFKIFKLVGKVGFKFYIFLAVLLFLTHLGLLFGYLGVRKTASLVIYLQENLANGVFFNLGISIISTSIYALIEIIIDKRPHFNGFRILNIVIAFIIIILYTGFFSSFLGDKDLTAIMMQIFCYVSALIYSIYLYLFQFLELDQETYAKLDDDSRDELVRKSKNIVSDDRGTKS